jgi:hypothetical protein
MNIIDDMATTKRDTFSEKYFFTKEYKITQVRKVDKMADTLMQNKVLKNGMRFVK